MREDNYSTGYSTTAPGFLGIAARAQLDAHSTTEDVG